ncbi:hypothetical protein B9Z19DRAFT_977536 [Tuber borchii]|uniref:VWFA domain-containing protein n=1 Tax=Tuber borchii TaxID=42251 RepID=A0A2T6ZWP2_TUBBO|nr:hypothetical protein B9Z19DRAFT_977536 [Tuber borchii]
MISEGLKNLVERQEVLRKIYGDTEEKWEKSLEDSILRGEEMVRALVGMNCGVEVAIELTLLTLYDVAILIDDSSTMILEEDGQRKDTLIGLIKEISEIFSMANGPDAHTMHFLNTRQVKKGTDENWGDYLDRHKFGGVTRIGTELKKQILDEFVIQNSNQSKPLLVLILTDGAIEGERKNHLKEVIEGCADVCERAGNGRTAVSFQFSRIGNDPDAHKLFLELDDDPVLGEFIDVLDIGLDPKNALEDKWFAVPKILLGAISPRVRPPHLNSRAPRFANNRQQWDE